MENQKNPRARAVKLQGLGDFKETYKNGIITTQMSKFLTAFIVGIAAVFLLFLYKQPTETLSQLQPLPSITTTPTSTSEPTATPTPSIKPTVKSATSKQQTTTGRRDIDPNNLPVINNAQVLSLVNSYRSQKGLNQLTTTPNICNLAENRASALFANNMKGVKDSTVGNHAGFDDAVAGQSGYVGENLMSNVVSAQEAFNGWLSSPPHEELMRWDEWKDGDHITHACAANRVGVNGSVVVFLLGADQGFCLSV